MSEEVEEEVLKEEAGVDGLLEEPPGIKPADILTYLIIKGSIGSFFDRRLLLLVSDLNHHTGVDVLPHQLSGFCDVDGDLQIHEKVQAKPDLVIL